MKLQRSGQGNALPILREERQFSKSQRYEFFQHYQPRLPENMYPTSPKTKAILARARKSSSSLSGGRWQRPGKQILCGKVYMTGLLLPFEQTSSHYWIWKVQKKEINEKKLLCMYLIYLSRGRWWRPGEHICCRIFLRDICFKTRTRSRVSQKIQKSEIWKDTYPSGFHRLDEPP